MKIAVLAWGSLIWDRRDLQIVGDFEANGPVLPLEFCRISGGGRLTLVVNERYGQLCKTYSAPSAFNALDAQRVFRFGAALGRRFARVPIPAPPADAFGEVLATRAADLPEEFRKAILGLYDAHYRSDATRLGPALFLAMCG
jgi:hypothetical protein